LRPTVDVPAKTDEGNEFGGSCLERDSPCFARGCASTSRAARGVARWHATRSTMASVGRS